MDSIDGQMGDALIAGQLIASEQVAGVVREAVRTEMSGMFSDLRRFVDRRIAELSAEVHATVQLLDYSEANLSGQLSLLHDQVASVLSAPTQAARNSGMELESVVQATEEAANRIMAAAEAIDEWVQTNNSSGGEAMISVSEKINAIFEACSFQDLTSQRIRRAIQHLQTVETTLEKMIPPGTVAVAAPEVHVRDGMVAVNPDNTINPDMAQAAIDALMDF